MFNGKPLLVVALVLSLGGIVAPPARSVEPNEEVQDRAVERLIADLRSDLGARRDSAMRALVQLTEDQAKKFWPIKEEYDKELRAHTEKRLALTKEYAGVHDKLDGTTARDLAERSMKLEEAHVALHRKYFRRIADEVSPVAAVQFLQLQRQFETMADAKLAASVPLAKQ